MTEKTTNETSSLANATPKFQQKTIADTIDAPDFSTDQNGLPDWSVVCIILVILLIACALTVGAYFLIKRVRDRRRNHGEYRPQLEESLHAKNLPYISPPNIEGLI